jgi:hypothetical protein
MAALLHPIHQLLLATQKQSVNAVVTSHTVLLMLTTV